MISKKIIIISNTAWYLYNFRLNLMRSLREQGHTLTAIAPPDDYVARIQEAEFSFVPVPMNRKGKNPFEDLLLLYRFWSVFRREKPGVVLTYTPKPNIYASLAARLLRIPVINNIAGLGNVFAQKGMLSTFIMQLYKLAFSRSYKIYFQNNDDFQLFLDNGIVNKVSCERIPGSGVDLAKFVPLASPRPNDTFVFMLIARLLWDKGVGEFVEAARLLKKKYPHVACHLVGFIDADNPQGVSAQQVNAWTEEGVVHYWGASDNIREAMEVADCVVLPSFYREGVPKVLLEAASMAKPIITTDAIGCRDAVENGVTGYLCSPRDSADLVQKMERMLLLPKAERDLMGQRGREKMTREFDERFVIERYTTAINRLQHCPGNSGK